MHVTRFELRPGPWTRLFTRQQPRVFVDAEGLEIHRGGEVERLPLERLQTLELRHARQLILSFGAGPAEQLELAIGRLGAADQFDRLEELRRQARPEGEPGASIENGLLSQARPWTLAELGCGEAQAEGFSLTAADAAGRRQLDCAGEQFFVQPLQPAEPEAGLQVCAADGSPLLCVLPGRVYNASGLLVASFERWRQAAGALRGLLLHLPDGERLEYHRFFRSLDLGGQSGAVRMEQDGAEVDLPAAVPRGLLLLFAGTLALVGAQRFCAPPLRDAAPEDVFIREANRWRMVFILASPFLATAVLVALVALMDPDLVWVVSGAGLLGGVIGGVSVYYVQRWIGSFLRRVKRQGEAERAIRERWVAKGGLHLKSGLLQFCPGMVFPDSVAFSYRDVGHLERRSRLSQVTLGLGGRPVLFFTALLRFDEAQLDQVAAEVRSRAPGHPLSRRRDKQLGVGEGFDWAALWRAEAALQLVELLPGRALRFRAGGRDFALRGFGGGRMSYKDALGRVPLLQFAGFELRLHNGMVLAEVQRRGPHKGDLKLCTGESVSIDWETGVLRLDGELYAEVLPGKQALRFAAPCPPILALLLVGHVFRNRRRLRLA